MTESKSLSHGSIINGLFCCFLWSLFFSLVSLLLLAGTFGWKSAVSLHALLALFVITSVILVLLEKSANKFDVDIYILKLMFSWGFSPVCDCCMSSDQKSTNHHWDDGIENLSNQSCRENQLLMDNMSGRRTTLNELMSCNIQGIVRGRADIPV